MALLTNTPAGSHLPMVKNLGIRPMKSDGDVTKPLLQGGHITLRTPVTSDADWRMTLGRHPGIVRMFGGIIDHWEPVEHEEAVRWISGLITHPHAWIIETNQRGIGEIRLDGLNPDDETARLAIGIYDPDLLGQGLGTEATRILLSHAFGTLRLHRVSLRVLDFNTRAIASYRRCGFRIEGRERQNCRIGDERHDDIIMGLLRDEFEGQSPSTS
jgi:RimJ/RimL family protein N-acetyltransferase